MDKYPNYEEMRAQIEETIFSLPVDKGTNIYVHIYKPKSLIGKTDSVCFLQLHGGAAIYLDPMVTDATMMDLALKLNVVFVAPNYRKAPEYPQPAGTLDCIECIKWCHANSEKLGVSKDKIVAQGTSGGALLALSAARHMSEKEDEKDIIKLLYIEAPMIANL